MKRLALLLCLSACLLLCGCVGQQANPLVAAEATAAPGTAPTLPAAEASDASAASHAVTLYFRYADQPFLAAEMRTLTVRRDETLEQAIVEALLDGPGADASALQALLPDAARLLEVSSSGETLYVTFSMPLLTGDGIPADWQQQEEWAVEAPLRRRLAMASLACAITENTAYTAVQVMVRQEADAKTSFRLDKSYFLGGESGPADPLTRDEALLSTPHQSALRVLTAWQGWDGDALYALIAGERPERLRFSEVLDSTRSAVEFTASAGGMSPGLNTATVNVSLTTADAYGETKTIADYPLRLILEDGVWKIGYDALLRLLAQ